MNTRLRKRERPFGMVATREHLMKHARALFKEKGFKGASIGELVARAGGSKETVYRHFKSKEALLAAVFSAEHEHYRGVLESLRSDQDDAQRGLTDLAEGMLVELTSDRAIALRRMMTAETRGKGGIGRVYYEQYSMKGYELVESFLTRYQASGDLKPLDSMHLAEYFGAMVLYRAMIMRQCSVIKPMTRRGARRIASRIVDDFLEAFGA